MAGGVIKPWVSHENQTVAGGGQAASFKSASDFMAPGGGDNGLAALARGLGQLSGAMYEFGMKDRQERQQVALLEDVQNFRRASDQFMTDYMANNQGASAGEASAAYQAWSNENFTPLRDKWASVSPAAEQYIVQHAGGIVTGGLDSMLGYQRGQTEKWYDSAVGGELARLNDIASRPDATQEQLEQAWGGVRSLTKAYYGHKGLDPGAAEVEADQQFRKLSATKALSTFNALLKTDPGAAAAFLDEGLKAPESGASSPEMISMAAKPSLNRDDLAMLAQDPNVKKMLDAISWAEGADYGTLVGGGQFSDFSRHPKKSIHIGRLGVNSTAAVRYQFVGRTWDGLANEFGFTDFTPETQDMAAVALLQRRGVLKDVLEGNWEKVVNSRGMSEEWASFPKNVYGQGGKSARALMDRLGAGAPLSSLFTQAEIAEMKSKAVQAMDNQMIKELTAQHASAVDNNSEMEIAEANLAAVEKIKAATRDDSKRRVELLDALAKNQQFADKERLIRDGVATEEYYTAAEGMSPLDRQKLLGRDEWRGKFSRATWSKLMEAEQKGPGDQITEQAFDALKVEIDRRNNGEGGLKPYEENELKAIAYRAGCTREKVKELLEYRANGGMAGVDGFAGKVQELYLEYMDTKGKTPDEKKAMMPRGFLRLVAQQLQPGVKPSGDELRRAVAMAMLRNQKGLTEKTFDRSVSPRNFVLKASDFGLSDAGMNFSYNFAEEGGFETTTSSRTETGHDAFVRNQFDQWLPDVEDREKKQINKAWKRRAIKRTRQPGRCGKRPKSWALI